MSGDRWVLLGSDLTTLLESATTAPGLDYGPWERRQEHGLGRVEVVEPSAWTEPQAVTFQETIRLLPGFGALGWAELPKGSLLLAFLPNPPTVGTRILKPVGKGQRES